MDKEDFIAWKDSPATQEVLKRLRDMGGEEIEALNERARALLSSAPSEWAAAQPEMAQQHGAAYQKAALLELEFKDLFEEPKTE